MTFTTTTLSAVSIVAASLAAMIAATGANAADAQSWSDCRSKDTARVEMGCSRIIVASDVAKSDLAEALVLRAKARSTSNDLDGAAADLDRAIAERPDYGTAYLERGRVNEQKGSYALATADYEKAASAFDEAESSHDDTSAKPAVTQVPSPPRIERKPMPKAAAPKRRVIHKKARHRRPTHKPHHRMAGKSHHKPDSRPRENIRAKVDKQINCSIAAGFDC